MLRLVLLCAGLAAVQAQTTAVSQCINHEGDLPINTYIEGCTSPPCALPQLQDCVINIIFRAPRTARSMRTLAVAYMSLGIIPLPPINYDLQANAVTCNFLTNTYCPVLEGEVVQYTLRMFIESFFPVNASPTIEFRVVDDNNNPMLCLRVPITVAPPVQNQANTARNATLVIDAGNL